MRKIIWGGELQFRLSSGKFILEAVNSTTTRLLTHTEDTLGDVSISEESFLSFIAEAGLHETKSTAQHFLGVELKEGDTLRNNFNNRTGAIAGNLSLFQNKEGRIALSLEDQIETIADVSADLNAVVTQTVFIHMRKIYEKRSPHILAALDTLIELQQQVGAFTANRANGLPLTPQELLLLNDVGFMTKAFDAVFDLARAYGSIERADTVPHMLYIRSP